MQVQIEQGHVQHYPFSLSSTALQPRFTTESSVRTIQKNLHLLAVPGSGRIEVMDLPTILSSPML
eukprot:m.303084 g.303084  ORF g.303084 m.303084 type:complete len:65 (+) comp16320_c0_seq2:932-1126(+)